MREILESCLADYSIILEELALIIDAKYMVGAFEEAEEDFISSGKPSESWVLMGESGQLIVIFEKYEGYYFSEFIAAGSAFQKGKELIRNTYLAQGGNPNKF